MFRLKKEYENVPFVWETCKVQMELVLKKIYNGQKLTVDEITLLIQEAKEDRKDWIKNELISNLPTTIEESLFGKDINVSDNELKNRRFTKNSEAVIAKSKMNTHINVQCNKMMRLMKKYERRIDICETKTHPHINWLNLYKNGVSVFDGKKIRSYLIDREVMPMSSIYEDVKENSKVKEFIESCIISKLPKTVEDSKFGNVISDADLYLFNSSLHDDEEYINETKQIRKRMMSHISRTVTSIIISMRLDGSPKVYVKQDKFLGFINSIIR